MALLSRSATSWLTVLPSLLMLRRVKTDTTTSATDTLTNTSSNNAEHGICRAFAICGTRNNLGTRLPCSHLRQVCSVTFAACAACFWVMPAWWRSLSMLLANACSAMGSMGWMVRDYRCSHPLACGGVSWACFGLFACGLSGVIVCGGGSEAFLGLYSASVLWVAGDKRALRREPALFACLPSWLRVVLKIPQKGDAKQALRGDDGGVIY